MTVKLVISSKNYSSWSLRGWLLARLSGLPFTEETVDQTSERNRDELLLRSSSILVPCLEHEGFAIWDTLAIAEYLHELRPRAGMFPEDRKARARCRSVSGEMHAGFHALRSGLPMNLRAHHPGFSVWSGARKDIDRIVAIWRSCLEAWGGPFLFGSRMTVADAMFAPVTTRFRTYDVRLDPVAGAYCELILARPEMQEWRAAALEEPEALPELEADNWPA